jgi:endoglucanase
MLGTLSITFVLAGCLPSFSAGQSSPCFQSRLQNPSTTTVADLALPQTTANLAIMQQSWLAYRSRFIQADGRVIDREAGDRTTSEGQAYALLRSVLINDPDTFAHVFQWADTNLARHDAKGNRIDQLWAWKWGQSQTGAWEILDHNFASDADVDTATALILASRRWNCPEYLDLARAKLEDIWTQSTATIAAGDRYLLPGPRDAFWNQPDTLILNPSYFAPYAFRLFAQVDSTHDWLSLVESGYRLLDKGAAVSKVGLPADWIALDPQTGDLRPLPVTHPLQSLYGFDAYRVWWRIGLDASWFQTPQAAQYLQRNTQYLQNLWRSQQKIPAQMTLQGKPTVTYEATPQYAMLYSALRLVNPDMAAQLYQRKLMANYRDGFWDNNSAYYTQNLAWFALLPTTLPDALLRSATMQGNQLSPLK